MESWLVRPLFHPRQVGSAGLLLNSLRRLCTRQEPSLRQLRQTLLDPSQAVPIAIAALGEGHVGQDALHFVHVRSRDPRDEVQGEEAVVARLRAEEGRVDLDFPDMSFLLNALIVDVVGDRDVGGDDEGAGAFDVEGIGKCPTGLVTSRLRDGNVHGGVVAD